ncbi:MAG: pyridoxamine 5'-phosphate oxidase family protein [Solirubrobacterales bacterium]|nr:pyridoxamine 5'-phosphate oxidase family protein [Solirubrobacterales bacterium]
MGTGWRVDAGFDLDEFLQRPLIARVATAGPTVRPVWYLWEDRVFWWLTGGWSRLPVIVERDPRVAVVVDTCNLQTGQVLQVTARGSAELLAFDASRARRWGRRYLGAHEGRWDRFEHGVFDDPSTRFVRVVPVALRARDLSYEPAAPEA